MSLSADDQLGDLRAITDVALDRLAVEDLLVEILERLRGLLDADTAAVLLREPGGDHLVARAACGLEEEVRQAVHVPIGAGFAGSIAATRKPVMLDRIDETTVANPVLWEKGIQVMLGVPLLVGEDVTGVLHVGRLRRVRFSEHDVTLLELAAARVAAAVVTRRLAVEAAAATVLERGLLPTRLPRVPGIRFATRYAPAHNRSVGGDWFDAFTVPSGELWLVVGDVAGHGFPAAVVMGRVKSALRAYALLGEPPARVIERTDRKVLHFEMGMMVTVICAVARAPYTSFEIVSAGHLPAVLATPGRPTRLVRVTPGPPLGVAKDVRRVAERVPVPPGSTLLFYTDGLIERRDQSLDFGLERLERLVAAGEPELVCRDVMHRLVGGEETLDDIAILAVRTSDEAYADDADVIAESEFPPVPTSAGEARRFVLGAVGDLADEHRTTLRLLVSELATNCVLHAKTAFTVRVVRRGADIVVEVSDSAPAPVRLGTPWPTDLGGRGMHLVRELAKDWGVRPRDDHFGKIVWFAIPALTGEQSG